MDLSHGLTRKNQLKIKVEIPPMRLTPRYSRYLKFSNKQNVNFMICSDEKIAETHFEGLNYTICNGNLVEDLFTLASCDAIIGSNSTFGAWASYYGNIPLIVFERDQIDWEYYKNKDMNKFNLKNNI